MWIKQGGVGKIQNQSKQGSKIPSFKIGGVNPNSIKIGGKTALKPNYKLRKMFE